MRWKSFLRFFTRAWRQARTPIRKRPEARYRQLTYDVLEAREMLSGSPPTIVQAGVLPVTGSTTSATPTLQIEFSDSMTNAALNPNNYVLLGSNGTPVSIETVTFANGTTPVDDEVDLTYDSGNAGNVLVVDTYTLYVRGNNLVSATTGLSVSQPGQLFAANTGRDEVSVANIPGTSGLGAASDYTLPFTSPTSALPNAVALADVNGDTIPDLIVANEGTNEVNIYAGQSAAEGGGYSTTPTLTLALPSATPTASTAESIVVGDFNGATFPGGEKEMDIAVASGNSDSVSVFMNTSTAVGVTSFAAGVVYDTANGTAIGADPVGITAADFDGSGNLSLAVATSVVSGGNYYVDLLPGSSTGAFGALQQVVVGTSAPTGSGVPTSIASGVFTAGGLPEMVVGGSAGLVVVPNNSTSGSFVFGAPVSLGATPIDSVAVGPLSAGGENSIAALTTGSVVQVYDNNGSGNGSGFNGPYDQTLTNAGTGQLAIGDLNNTGDGDIVVTNDASPGGVTVVKNFTIGGTVTSASRTANDPIVVLAPGNNLTTGDFVTITGVQGFAAANVTGTAITILGDNITSINAVNGAVTVTTATSGALYGLVTGDTVTIAGTGVADGTFTLTSVNVAGNTFTYTDGTVSGTASTTGNWADANKFILNGTTSAAAGSSTKGGTWSQVGAITAASETGGVAPIVVTSPSNGLVTGDAVVIQGVPGYAGVNNLAPTLITVLGSSISQVSVATADTLTVTPASIYGLAVGDNVIISGSSLAVANGEWQIATINGGTYTINNAAFSTVVASATGGAWSSPDKFTLDSNDTAGASSGAGGTWTTQTSFGTGADINYATGTAVTATVTNNSATVTLNNSSTTGLSVGMEVSGFAGIPAGTTIASILSSTQILLSADATAAGANVPLTFTTFYSTDADPVGVAIGDTNGDGNLDVVTANDGANANDVTLLLGNGDGTLQYPANITTAINSNPPQNIIVADLNDNGIPDVIIANDVGGDNNTKITIYQGIGNGQYDPGVNITPGNVQNIVALGVGHFSNASTSSADFPDIVYVDGNGGDNDVGFLQNNITVAGATITAADFTASGTVAVNNASDLTSLAVGNLNNNNAGLDDLVIGSDGGGGFHGHPPEVSVLINTSTSTSNFTFNTQNQYDTGGNSPISAVAVGDFTNDGNLDFVAAVDSSPGEIYWNTGTGTGTFSSGTEFATTVINPVALAVGDFTNNGYEDVVVASASTATAGGTSGVAVLLNQLGTGFGTPIVTPVAPGTALQNIAVDDINGTGDADLVVSTAPVTGSITTTSASGATPIVISTNSSVADLVANQTVVTVYGVAGDTAANGTWTVGTITTGGHGAPNTFQLLGSTANANATANTGTWVIGDTNANVFLLIGNGTGGFEAPTPYLVGPQGTPVLGPTELAITPTPLDAVTTFTSGGDLIQTNLVNNGSFDSRDLSGEQGNLLGWGTYNDPYGNGSAGAWVADNSTTSPLSGTSVPAPIGGNYQALLDEPNVVPVIPANVQGGMNPQAQNNNTVASYSGGHALYQDVTIPADATSAELSLSLYINNTGSVGGAAVTGAGGYSDPLAADTPDGNPSLSFNTSLANQQVRVDIMAVQLITGATDPASGPIVITSPDVAGTAGDGLVSGEQVTIEGVEGNTAANGTWFVDVLTANTFALYASYDPNNSTFADPSVGSGAYTANTGNWTENFLSVNSSGTGPDQVVEQLFQTYGAADATVPSTPYSTDATTYSGVISASLEAFKGETIRIRIGEANNQGPLLVAVNDVQLDVQFADTAATKPTLSPLAVNNPSFFSNGIPYTNDPTITGTINAPYGLSSIAYIAFDPTNGNFTSSSVVKSTQWDASGNFSYTLQSATPGLNTIGVEVVDRAGNVTNTTFSFFLQTNSVTQWDPIGPTGIATENTNNAGVDFADVSGRITATLADSLDPSGNTYLVGTPNGGIWRTTDGGKNWTSVSNSVVNASNTPVAVSVGALAQAAGDPNVMYAGTGVGDDQTDSLAGVGILKSVNDGLTWNLLAGSVADFNGARVTSIVVDPNDPTGAILWAAVASGGAGPGVYRSTDGGNTWTNITNPAANMHITSAADNWTPSSQGALIGGSLGSVTSMVINPYSAAGFVQLFIGVGSIGLGVAASATGGVWITNNADTADAADVSWAQIVGNNLHATIQNDSLPSGNTLGRVTVALGTATSNDVKYLYVLIGNIGPGAAPGSADYGTGTAGNNIIAANQTTSGLYKSSDGGYDFTQVGLMQDIGTYQGVGLQNHDFVDINLLGNDADNAGSLAVDPTDPNALYVGGSSFYYNVTGIDDVDHAFIYVDTGDMVAGANIDGGINNGDDIQKYNQAVADGLDYDPVNLGDPYQGEGVYWYDIIEAQSGKNGNSDLLPGEITSMTVDSLGRLLVGTVGGIWRGVDNGLSYDFTSGGDGILAQHGMHGFGGNNFSTAGMSFTSINGNLQISDMTSVAIDPVDADTFYTTQVDTGVASYSPTTGWVSQGLTGPTLNGNNLGIPTADVVLTAETASGSVDLYRIWQNAAAGALLPEVSTDGGATWTSISGIPAGPTAGEFPAFTINPTVLYAGNPALPFNQLLFGSSPIEVTTNSADTWNAAGEPTTPAPAAGASPTAAAIAPSSDTTYYIGDDEGEIWATTSAGGAWTLATGAADGLPAVSVNSPVEGIAVNPTNAAEVFALYGGTGSVNHVYVSNNSGVSFSAIAGPWGSADAYSMVIDPTAALGAPQGKIYLATQVGVYVSINGGSNWSVLGQGMPNVPVVDLAYNSNLQTLAAATLGRGVFTINTSAISVIPTQTVSENTTFAPTTSAAIPFTVNDTGGAGYTITATSSNQNLIANKSITIGGSGFNRTIQFTPVLNAFNTPVNGNGGAGDGDWQGPNSGATAETITLRLTSSGLAFTQTFNVAVDFVNYPPTVTTPGNVTISASSPAIPITVGDVETPAGELVLQASSANQALLPNGNLNLGGSESITAASWNANVVTITAANTFTAGQQVYIAGMTPAGYDGAYTITSASAAGFTYTLAANPGEPGGTATITAASWALGVATITAANTFTAGEKVVIAGMTPAGYNNGGVAVTIVTASATQFTYDLVSNPGTGTTFGTATLQAGTVLGAATTANRTLTVTPLVASITAVAWNNNVATITANNNFTVGQTVVILGATPSGYNTGGSPVTITAANATSFSYALTTDPGSSGASSGTASEVGSTVITLTVTDSNGGITQKTFNVLVTFSVTLPFADNFNSPANSTFVGPGWNTNLGAIARVNGVIVPSGALNIASLNGLSQGNIALQADVSVGAIAGQQAGLIARYGGAGNSNYYLGSIYNYGGGYEAVIWKNVNGALTPLSAALVPTSLTALPITSASWANGTVTVNATNNYTAGQTVVIAGMTPAAYNGTYRIVTATSTSFTYALAHNPQPEAGVGTASVAGAGTLFFDVSGSSLKLYYGAVGTTTPTLLTYAFSTSLTTGTAGFLMTGTSTGVTTLDNFAAAAIPAPATQSLPFGDTFTTAGTLYTSANSSSQLDANWISNLGNFTDNTGAGAAVGTAGANNVATVSGVNATDVSLTANITMAVGQMGGLVARYTAAGTFYLARIQQVSATQITATILKYVNGGYYGIASSYSSTVPANANSADAFTFQVEGPSLQLFLGSSLIAYASDFSLASGSVGIFAYGAADISAFNANPVISGQAMPFTDNFNNTSPGYPSVANQLAPQSWVALAGNYNVSTGNAVSTEAGYNVASVVLTTPATDVSVQATATLATGQVAGLIARSSALTDSYYVGRIYQFSPTQVQAAIYKYINGNPTLIGVYQNISGVAAGASDNLVFQVEGPSIKLFLNGNLVAYAEDTTLTSGSVGMYSYGVGVTFDSPFNAGPVTPAATAQALTFSDNFASGNFGNQLSTASWEEQQGNFNLSTNSAVGTGATNLATVIGLNAGDVSVSANVTLAIGQQAGLVARWSGPLSNNMYYAEIYQVNAGQVEALIYKNVNGAVYLIGTPKIVAAPDNTSDPLVFQVEGPSLKLFLNGTLIGYAEDTSLTSGSVGIRTVGAAAVAAFNASPVSPAATAQTLTFNDSFASGNFGNQLSTASWEEQEGNFNLSTGSAVGTGATNLATVIGLSVGDVSVSANVTLAPGQYAALVSRWSGPLANNMYYGRIYQLNSAQVQCVIFKVVNGVTYLVGTPQVINAPANTSLQLVFDTEGTSLKLYYNDTLVEYGNDAALTTGSVGMLTASTAAVANFQATSLGVAQTTTFNDSLTTGSGPSNNQLNPSAWTEQAGNFTVSASGAKGKAAINLATVYGLSYANQTLSETVAFTAVNQSAGLVARYSGPFDENYYYASVTALNAAGTTVSVELWKNVNGTLISLTAPKTVTGFAGGLEFTVTGNTLELITDNVNVQYSITDNSITAAGLAGIRATSGATVSNFTAS